MAPIFSDITLTSFLTWRDLEESSTFSHKGGECGNSRSSLSDEFLEELLVSDLVRSCAKSKRLFNTIPSLPLFPSPFARNPRVPFLRTKFAESSRVFFSESFSRSTDLEMAEDAPASSPFTCIRLIALSFPPKGSCLVPFCLQWQAGILEVCDFPKEPQIFLLNNIQ